MREYTDLEKLRIAAAVQENTVGCRRFEIIITKDIASALNAMDRHNQNFSLGDKYTYIHAKQWPSFIERGMSGIYPIKDTPFIIELPLYG